MSVEEVLKMVEHIKEVSEDDEVAHKKEKELWQVVLQTIANGSDNPKELARATLNTMEIEFNRQFT